MIYQKFTSGLDLCLDVMRKNDKMSRDGSLRSTLRNLALPACSRQRGKDDLSQLRQLG